MCGGHGQGRQGLRRERGRLEPRRFIHSVDVDALRIDSFHEREHLCHPEIAYARFCAPARIDLIADVEAYNILVRSHYARQLSHEELLGRPHRVIGIEGGPSLVKGW